MPEVAPYYPHKVLHSQLDFVRAKNLRSVHFNHLTSIATGAIRCAYCPQLAYVGLPALVRARNTIGHQLLSFTNCDSLWYLHAGQLTAASSIQLTNNRAMWLVYLPLLANQLWTGDFTCTNNDALTVLLLPKVVNFRYLDVRNNALLQTLYMPALEVLNDGNKDYHHTPCVVTGNPALSTITLDSWRPTANRFYDFRNNALSQATVDAIIMRAYLTSAFTGAGSILGISGGTNASPSEAVRWTYQFWLLNQRGVRFL